VVLKPAETTPDTALLLAAHAMETLGPGVVTTLTGGRETGRLLVESAVDAIAFTGSEAGGLDVVARVGLRRISLELGGNCAAIVLPDAPDFGGAAIVDACTNNSGQSCAAPVGSSPCARTTGRRSSAPAKEMPARQPGIAFGPLNNLEQLARHDAIVEASSAGVRRCGDIAVGEDEHGGYWRPGRVLAEVPDDDPAVVEEVFGPVLTVQAAAGPDDADRMANGVRQALAVSVWGSDTSTVLGIAAGLDSGEVWVNCHLEQTPNFPTVDAAGPAKGSISAFSR
jgi:acyl-CoA reductase-like NAD-dependent aldehyde dehydrogenase